MFAEALEINRKIKGRKHPDYAVSLVHLANAHELLGQYKEAEALYLETLGVVKEVLGKEHPYYARSLTFLGDIYFSTGENEKAETFYLEADSIFLEEIEKNFRFLSEKEKEQFLQTMAGRGC